MSAALADSPTTVAINSDAMPDRYTAESTLRTRPKTYRKCVQLLAQGNSIASIAKQLRVSDNTVRAIKVRESQTIAERKAALISIFANVAEVSAERMEQLASKAKLTEAGICAGIATEKLLLLSGEATQRIEVSLDVHDIHSEFKTLKAEIVQSLQLSTGTVPAQPQDIDTQFLKLQDADSHQRPPEFNSRPQDRFPLVPARPPKA